MKNPTSGRIEADSIGEIIIDKNIKAPADCEIIIMGTIVGNEAGGFNTPTLKPLLTDGFKEIAEDFESVVSIDIYNLHSYMLESKNYVDLSGNNVNHPNDYMIRVHAMQLLATLVDFSRLK